MMESAEIYALPTDIAAKMQLFADAFLWKTNDAKYNPTYIEYDRKYFGVPSHFRYNEQITALLVEINEWLVGQGVNPSTVTLNPAPAILLKFKS